jgi:hypothetical protein
MDSKGVHKSLGRFEFMMLSWRKTNRVRAKRKASRRVFRLVLPALLAWLMPSLANSAIVHEATLSADSADLFVSTISVNTVASGTDQLYIAAVAIYGSASGISVSTITGGSGLTWTLQKSQCSRRLARAQVEVWQAFGSPGASFNTDITLTGTAVVTAAVSRYSGADSTTPTEGAAGSNTAGLNGICDGLDEETVNLSLSLTSSNNDSVLFVASHPRNKSITTPDADYTERMANTTNADGGSAAYLYVHDRTLATAGTDSADHTIGSVTGWDMAGLVINPAGAGSLVGHWNFDEGSGQTAADSTANNNDATLGTAGGADANDPVWVCVNGGYALSFDGTDDIVNAGSAASLDDMEPFTISAWIKPDSAGSSGFSNILAKHDTGNGQWFLERDNTAPDVNAYEFSKDHDTDVKRVTSDNTVTYDVWQHIAVTWDGSTTASNIHIYKDGVETGYAVTSNGSGTKYSDAARPFVIGNGGDLASPFYGLIDDVRVYNSVLSQAEITTLAASTPTDCGATPAVTSAVAEISPNDVTTSSTANAFSYDIQATIGGGDTGVDRGGDHGTGDFHRSRVPGHRCAG